MISHRAGIIVVAVAIIGGGQCLVTLVPMHACTRFLGCGYNYARTTIGSCSLVLVVPSQEGNIPMEDIGGVRLEFSFQLLAGSRWLLIHI